MAHPDTMTRDLTKTWGMIGGGGNRTNLTNNKKI